MIKTSNNHELVKGVLSAYQNPLYNETDEHRIVAWLTVLICCDSFCSIKKKKVFKPRRVQIPLEIEATCVGQSKMASKSFNGVASDR